MGVPSQISGVLELFSNLDNLGRKSQCDWKEGVAQKGFMDTSFGHYEQRLAHLPPLSASAEIVSTSLTQLK